MDYGLDLGLQIKPNKNFLQDSISSILAVKTKNIGFRKYYLLIYMLITIIGFSNAICFIFYKEYDTAAISAFAGCLLMFGSYTLYKNPGWTLGAVALNNVVLALIVLYFIYNFGFSSGYGYYALSLIAFDYLFAIFEDRGMAIMMATIQVVYIFTLYMLDTLIWAENRYMDAAFTNTLFNLVILQCLITIAILILASDIGKVTSSQLNQLQELEKDNKGVSKRLYGLRTKEGFSFFLESLQQERYIESTSSSFILFDIHISCQESLENILYLEAFTALKSYFSNLNSMAAWSKSSLLVVYLDIDEARLYSMIKSAIDNMKGRIDFIASSNMLYDIDVMVYAEQHDSFEQIHLPTVLNRLDIRLNDSRSYAKSSIFIARVYDSDDEGVYNA